MSKINKLRNEVYRIALEHGWHEEEHSCQHLTMLIVTEISEAVEADRKNRHADKSAFERDTQRALRELHLYGENYDTYESSAFNNYIKDTVEDELADVVIRVLDMCGLYNIDLDCMPEAFVLNDNEQDKSLITEIERMSMTEFAYSCTLRAMYFCEDDMRWGQIQILLHRVYLYSVIKGFDLVWHVKAKIKYNKGREYKHGKLY